MCYFLISDSREASLGKVPGTNVKTSRARLPTCLRTWKPHSLGLPSSSSFPPPTLLYLFYSTFIIRDRLFAVKHEYKDPDWCLTSDYDIETCGPVLDRVPEFCWWATSELRRIVWMRTVGSRG